MAKVFLGKIFVFVSFFIVQRSFKIRADYLIMQARFDHARLQEPMRDLRRFLARRLMNL
jgi:hypothetical protein